MIRLPKIRELIIHAGYNDFNGVVKEITPKPTNSILTLDKKGEEFVEIDIEKVYAITHLKK